MKKSRRIKKRKTLSERPYFEGCKCKYCVGQARLRRDQARRLREKNERIAARQGRASAQQLAYEQQLYEAGRRRGYEEGYGAGRLDILSGR